MARPAASSRRFPPREGRASCPCAGRSGRVPPSCRSATRPCSDEHALTKFHRLTGGGGANLQLIDAVAARVVHLGALGARYRDRASGRTGRAGAWRHAGRAATARPPGRPSDPARIRSGEGPRGCGTDIPGPEHLHDAARAGVTGRVAHASGAERGTKEMLMRRRQIQEAKNSPSNDV